MRERTKAGAVRIGVGGWTYEPWRGGVFYPPKWPQKRELEYASRHLTSIEVNGTFYRTQKPEVFARWRQEAPEDFVFSLKGPRFVTARGVLAEAGDSVRRFLESGVTELGPKLGPILWQLAPEKKFDAADFAAFLNLLPKALDGLALRHAVEVRHESFVSQRTVELAREHDVAIVVAADSKYPLIGDITAPFVYVRAMGATATHALGYSEADLNLWARRVKLLAKGHSPQDWPLLDKPRAAAPREVFLYFIAGHKAHNPSAAMALIDRLA